MKVKDCYRKVSLGVEVVKKDDPIEALIEALCKEHASRSIYVVDDEGKLLGIINMTEIFRLLGSKYLPKEALPHIASTMAQKAEDLMVPPIMIHLDDDTEEALKLAVINQLEDLPVVDREDRVVGNLDCFEILKGIEHLCPVKISESDEKPPRKQEKS